MKLKKVLVSASLMGISVTALPTYAEEEAKVQTKSMDMLQQADAYAEKAGRNYSYTQMSQDQERVKSQPKYRFGADNDTGKGTKVRTRSRDGSTSGIQNHYKVANGSKTGSRQNSGRH